MNQQGAGNWLRAARRTVAVASGSGSCVNGDGGENKGGGEGLSFG